MLGMADMAYAYDRLFVGVWFIVGLGCGTALFLTHYRVRRKTAFLGVLPAFALLVAAFPLADALGMRFPVIAMAAYYLVAVALVMMLVRWIYDVWWLEALITVVMGYAMQHIAFDSVMLLASILGSPIPSTVPDSPLIMMAAFLVPYAVFFGAVYWLIGRRFVIDHERIRDRRIWVSLSAVMLALIIVANLMLESTSAQTQRFGYSYDLLCTAMSVIIMLLSGANDILHADLTMIRRTEQLKAKQYEISRETIGLINIKCHDFRKSVASLSRGVGASSREAVKQVEDSIRIYESMYRTGNDSLDAILTDKSLYCSARGIALDCMADGWLLGDFGDVEMYALFGNIVDNAIGAVEQVPDTRRRLIELTVRESGGLVLIEENNYYEGTLVFREGLPVTTKGDSGYHGFGMKSVERVVRAHDGELMIDAADGMFSLSIVLRR